MTQEEIDVQLEDIMNRLFLELRNLCRKANLSGVPFSLTIISGSNQGTGIVGQTLALPLVVELRDSLNAVIPNFPISWDSQDDGLVSQVFNTDINGRSTLPSWILGTRAGIQQMIASVGGSLIQQVFNETVAPGTVTGLVLVDGGAQQAQVSTLLPIAIKVRAEDQYTNPVPNFALTGSLTAGAGTLTGGSGSTDANGEFTITSWRMGAVAGLNTLHFVGTGVTLDINADGFSAGSGVPDHWVRISGDAQTGIVVNNALVTPFIAELRDINEVPVPNITVIPTVLIGGGGPGTSQLTTDVNGRISATPTVGTIVGLNTFRFSAGNVIVDFTASSVAGAFDHLTLDVSPPDHVTDNIVFPQQATVTRRDVYVNAILVSGVPITTSKLSGTATLVGTASKNTNALGQAIWTDQKLQGASTTAILEYASGGKTVDTVSLTVGAPITTQFGFLTQPPSSVVLDQSFSLDIEARDSLGNRNASDNTSAFNLDLGVNPGNDVLAGVISGVVTAGIKTVAVKVSLPVFPQPIIEMGTNLYFNFPGYLYNGTNIIPAAHAAAGNSKLASIFTRNTVGVSSPTGKIVLTSAGFSVTSQYWRDAAQIGSPAPAPNSWSFEAIAAADGLVEHTDLRIVNGATAGNGLSQWDGSIDQGNYDNLKNLILSPAGLTEAQVQIAVLDCVLADPTISLPSASADAILLVARIGNALRLMKSRWPNLQIVFLTSRNYSGYSVVTKNPEPYAFETAFAVKWIIQAQIDQMANGGTIVDTRAGDLNYNTIAPWIAWGPYWWANALTPRISDGLIWDTTDFESDGLHPSTAGETKLANMMLAFMKSDPRATPWFLA